jgi:hypothetical protein
MREIRPGLWHWTAIHPSIGMTVSGYHLVAERVLLDSVVPEGGAGVLGDPPPTDVLLTNRHHWRGCTEVKENSSYSGRVPCWRPSRWCSLSLIHRCAREIHATAETLSLIGSCTGVR